MHVQCLYGLMSTGLLFQSAFCWPCKLMTGEMVPKKASNFPVGTWYDSHCQWRLSWLKFVVDYWPFVGAYTNHSYSKLYYLCLLTSLFKLLSPPTQPLHPPSHPLLYTGPILINFMKRIVKNWNKLAIIYLLG